MAFQGLQDTNGVTNSILSGVQVGLRKRQIMEEEAARQQAIEQSRRDSAALAGGFAANHPGVQLFGEADPSGVSPAAIEYAMNAGVHADDEAYNRAWNEDQRNYTRKNFADQNAADANIYTGLSAGADLFNETGAATAMPEGFANASPGAQGRFVSEGLRRQEDFRQHSEAARDYETARGYGPDSMGPPDEQTARELGGSTQRLQQLTHEEWVNQREAKAIERARAQAELALNELDEGAMTGRFEAGWVRDAKEAIFLKLHGIAGSQFSAVSKQAAPNGLIIKQKLLGPESEELSLKRQADSLAALLSSKAADVSEDPTIPIHAQAADIAVTAPQSHWWGGTSEGPRPMQDIRAEAAMKLQDIQRRLDANKMQQSGIQAGLYPRGTATPSPAQTVTATPAINQGPSDQELKIMSAAIKQQLGPSATPQQVKALLMERIGQAMGGGQ